LPRRKKNLSKLGSAWTSREIHARRHQPSAAGANLSRPHHAREQEWNKQEAAAPASRDGPGLKDRGCVRVVEEMLR
jgi:hypothetical protein